MNDMAIVIFIQQVLSIFSPKLCSLFALLRTINNRFFSIINTYYKDELLNADEYVIVFFNEEQ